jgi:hypothetical protein
MDGRHHSRTDYNTIWLHLQQDTAQQYDIRLQHQLYSYCNSCRNENFVVAMETNADTNQNYPNSQSCTSRWLQQQMIHSSTQFICSFVY